MTKTELRKIFRGRRENFPEVAATSERIAGIFFEAFDLCNIKTLLCFIPISKFCEIETSLIYKKIWIDFPMIRTLAPRINFERREMESLEFTDDTELAENRWGILEPLGGEPVEPGNIDMVLVPLLCFDTHGHRVGYGEGFYDKFLRQCRPDCVKVGLSFFPPVAGITDVGGHDVIMDHCVTPETVFSFGERSI